MQHTNVAITALWYNVCMVQVHSDGLLVQHSHRAAVLLMFALGRYIPVDDLYNIYTELYGTVRLPREVIVDCTLEMYAERSV